MDMVFAHYYEAAHHYEENSKFEKFRKERFDIELESWFDCCDAGGPGTPPHPPLLLPFGRTEEGDGQARAADELRHCLTEGSVPPCRPLPCTAGVCRCRRHLEYVESGGRSCPCFVACRRKNRGIRPSESPVAVSWSGTKRRPPSQPASTSTLPAASRRDIAAECSSSVPAALTEWRRDSRRSVLLRCGGKRKMPGKPHTPSKTSRCIAGGRGGSDRALVTSRAHKTMDFTLSSLVAAFATTFVLYKLLRHKEVSPKIPEPGFAWPIIGHFHLLAGNDRVPHKVLGDLADKYRMKMGAHQVLVVSDSQTAKECLNANDRALAGRPKSIASEHIGYNYANFGMGSNTQFWREIRKVVVLELLSNRRVRGGAQALSRIGSQNIRPRHLPNLGEGQE
nr:cytochrome P450 CYP82D47-like [Ipomoea trifida]